jgi:chemotaxis protein methyltransferase CheR
MAHAMPDAKHRSETSIVPDSEFVFTASDFRKIAALVHGEAGIVLAEGKANLVYSRLAKRLRAIGLRSFRDYCALIESEDGAGERIAMISAMTTNVTKFFREPHHFDYLKAYLPPLIAAARAGQPVRLWSAGCSSGEEPHSIALTLLEAMPDAGERDVRILATDIDPDMIARGRAGTYPASALSSIPPSLRSRVLPAEVGSQATFSPEVRELIRFNELNLLAPWPMKGKFDIIFCRNVMIYFDEATQDEIWRKFHRILKPGGQLFIGHSERIATDRHPFDLVAQTTYQPRRTERP